jgi:glutaredoxin
VNIIVYTTGCPRCKILEKTLVAAGIDYIAVSDVEAIVKKGFETVPQMEVEGGDTMDFKAAMNWIKERSNG